MQALLDGKKLTFEDRYHDSGEKCLSFDSAGQLKWENGNSASLANHDWQIYEEPNPHAKGTFAWAREEASRGKKVARKAWSSRYWVFVDHGVFSLEDIDATDWVVV